MNARPPRLLLLIIVASLMPAIAAAASPGAGDPTALELAVKASYLTKFAPFVRWPPGAFASPQEPLTICVAGDDPFGPMLDDAARGQRVAGHPLAVKRLAAAAQTAACQILFVGRSANTSTEELLREVGGQPVLTVTDRSRGVAGGIVQFVLEHGRVRFAIDQAAADLCGLSISSKLLALAVKVTR